MATKYEFKDGSFPAGKAQAAGEEYAALRSETKGAGQDTTRKELEKVRRSPRRYPTLHALVFHKAQAKAAAAYYLARFRDVVANLVEVRITVTRAEPRPPVKVEINVEPAARRRAFPHAAAAYRLREEMDDPGVRKAHVSAALAGLRAWIDQWEPEGYVELKPLIDGVRVLLDEHAKADAA